MAKVGGEFPFVACRYDQNPYIWPSLPQFISQLHTIHPRHFEIRDEYMDNPVVLISSPQCLGTILGLQHAVAPVC